MDTDVRYCQVVEHMSWLLVQLWEKDKMYR